MALAAQRLDVLLRGAGLEIVGGTHLYRLVRTKKAAFVFEHLGRAGIIVRRFARSPTWLRFGLPGPESHWQRLSAALGDI